MDSSAYVRVMSHDSASWAIVKLPTPLEKYVLHYFVVYDGMHTAGIWFGHMPAAWHYYGSYMWLNHIAAILIPYERRVYYMQCDFHVQFHMLPVWYPHCSDMV